MLSLLASWLLLIGGSIRAQPIELVDFRNHTYSLVRFGHPDTITLEKGRAKFPDDPKVAPGISLLSVRYGDLDGDGLEEALVVLRYDSAGSALDYDYCFVFRMGPAGPKIWYSDQYESAAAIVLVGDTVVVNAPFWLPKDAHCCPTYDARYTIKSTAGKLGVVAKRLHRRTKSA